MKLLIIKDLLLAGHNIQTLSNYKGYDADKVYNLMCSNPDLFADLKFS